MSVWTSARTRAAGGPRHVTITTGATAAAPRTLGFAPRMASARAARLVAFAGAVAALAVAPAGASAAIVEPPPMPHVFTVFPDRDFVSVEGYDPGEQLSVRVLRNGVQIGSATGAAGADGLFEVNHPGGACWTGSTPNILARDQVVVAPAGSPADVGEATTTADLHASAAVEDAAGRIVVKGTAVDADGSAMDLGLIEQRIVNPDFRNVGLGKRDLRAVSDGSGQGTLTRDPIGPDNPDGTRWTAVYSGLTQAQRAAALDGQTRVLGWQATDAAGDRLGITIHEVGEVGGPGVGGCPQGADFAVTSSDDPAVTKAMVDAGRPLVLSGVSQDASAVSVVLRDEDSTTPDVTREASAPSPAPGVPPATVAQTWTVTFTADEVAGLADGTLTARGAYTVGAGLVTGKELQIAKDVVAPGAPDATPGGGTYATTQAVTLDTPDPASVIHYTANGTTPSAASRVAPAQLLISSSQVIKAVAVDPVGNTSPVSTFAYTITASAPGAGGASGGSGSAGSGNGGAPAAAPSSSGAGTTTPGLGQVLSAVAGTARPLALPALTTSGRISMARLRSQGLRVAVRLPAGTRAIRFAVYRARDGKPTGAALASGARVPSHAGSYRLTLRSRSLARKLRPGRYVVQVRAGRDAGHLGAAASVAFTVTR
jgi:Chitobiase/beta-hexosaminidase C-terminal domain